MAFVSTAVAVVGTAYSIDQANKASKAQKNANSTQRDINKLKNEQQKRAFLRNFRQTQAAALMNSVASGVGLESSGVQGTLASEQTQKATNLADFREFNRLGAEVASFQNRAATKGFNSAVGGSVASFASQFISAAPSSSSTSGSIDFGDPSGGLAIGGIK